MAGQHRKVAIAPYWKSAVAFLVPLVALLTTVASSEAIRNAVPGVATWLVAVGIPVLTLVATFLKRNQVLADQIDVALEKGDVSAIDVEEILARYRAGGEVTPPGVK